MELIESRLHDKTFGQDSQILFSQWDYDKKIAEKTLQFVSSYFPHYSNHDASHSKKILENIVRIIGIDRIELLSETDLWLLLEVAYFHDIGMVLSASEVDKAVKSIEFKEYLTLISDNNSHPLNKYSSFFEYFDKHLQYKEREYSLEKENAMKFLIAEYFRNQHGELSKKIIENPFEKLEFMRNQNLLVPERLFRLIGEIAVLHTRNFEAIFNLPIIERGFSTDDCHPRLIVALIRIADLLDIDNNRFYPFQSKTILEIPEYSKKHIDKHLSIVNLRIDNKRIEIKAECEDYEVYFLTKDWFDMIEKEISKQMLNWNNIFPDNNVFLLPTLGELSIKLKKYELIDKESTPSFTIDVQKSLELLQGAGIYESPFQSIRELLQNAVDSTLLRIWEQNKGIFDFSSPHNERIEELFSNHPIKVEISLQNTMDEYDFWEIKIKDNGIGISKDEIVYLQMVGSSYKNSRKRQIVNEMENWIRPSGIFGIGFQSVFLIADEIKLKTRSFYSNDLLSLSMNSPFSKKKGNIFIESEVANYCISPGVEISFIFKCNKIPKRISWSMNDRISNEIVDSYDPIINKSLSIEIGKIIDQIYDFGRKSYIPIELKWGNLEEQIYDKKRFDAFVEDCEFSIYPNNGIQNVFYRNQRLSENTRFLNSHFLGYELNILGYSAKDILSLNRNKIRTEKEQDLSNKYFEIIYKYINDNFDQIIAGDSNNEIIYSMFLNYYHNEKTTHVNDKWKEYVFVCKNSESTIEFTFAEILKKLGPNSIEVQIDSIHSGNSFLELTIQNDTISKIYISRWDYDGAIDFLLKEVVKTYKNIKVCNLEDYGKYRIIIGNIDLGDVISELVVREILLNLKQRGHSVRTVIPCLVEFKELELANNFELHYSSRLDLVTFPFSNKSSMLLPFRSYNSENYYDTKRSIEIDNCETKSELVVWVYENRKNKDVKIEEISNKYKEFVKKFRKTIESDNISI